jgi:hypothetical protein
MESIDFPVMTWAVFNVSFTNLSYNTIAKERYSEDNILL